MDSNYQSKSIEFMGSFLATFMKRLALGFISEYPSTCIRCSAAALEVY